MARADILRRIDLLTDAAMACLNAGKAHMALIWLRHARALGDLL